METTVPLKKRKKLPAWGGWLLGYALALALAVGLVYFWRVVFFLDGIPAAPLTLAAVGVFSLLYLALFLLFRLCRDKISLKASIAVFVVGLLFCFASAPLQAPDENNHFLRAYAIASGNFGYDASRGYPEDVEWLVQLFPGFYNHRVAYAAEELAPSAFAAYEAAKTGQSGAPAPQTEPVLTITLPFLPQALGIALARLFGFGALGCMYAGRIANLLVYAALSYFTFRNCHKYRGVFFAVVLLPLSLFMAASCSYDSVMLALCYLLVSYFCKKEIGNTDLIVFAVLLMLATYLKPMNFVLAAVLLLIPKERWKARANPRLAVLALVALALLFWFGLGQVDKLLTQNYGTFERGTGDENAPLAQVLFMLQNPASFVARVGLTFYEEGGFLAGLGNFGWVDMDIPLVQVLSVLSLCAAAALGIQQRQDTKWTSGLALFLASFFYSAAILAGMYVLATDLFSIRVTGVQARYFLPAILLLFMAASITLGKVVRPVLAGGQSAKRAENVALCIALAVAFIAAVFLFQNYFIGQWLPKASGQWKMVNLLGWQVL